MAIQDMPDNFYERIKPRLHQRIGRELRLARHVLDIGCGSCELVKYLATAYCQKVTGVDISGGSFPKMKHTSQRIMFRCLQQDATRLDFAANRSVDAVVATWALHEMTEPRSVLEETRRVLRPGGEILIIDFPRGSLAQRLWNESYYQPAEVKQLLQDAGFEDIKVRLIQQGQVIWACGYQLPAPTIE